jgi:ureidoacrylate peracid hydrolase
MKRNLFLLISILLLSACNNGKNDNSTTISNTEKPSTESKTPAAYVRVFAKPDSISIDVSKTAVIVVDMQNDFGSKGGMFDRAGINLTPIQNVIKPTAKVLDAAREAGIKIIYLKMGFTKDLAEVGTEEEQWHVGDTVKAPDGSVSRILVQDTWNTDIVTELKPKPGDIIVNKNRFSGFYKTELDSLLKKMGAKYLLFTGCTTSVCVESTVRDARFRNYTPVIFNDCTAEPVGHDLARSNHEASLFLMESRFGWISSSAEFIKAVNEPSVVNKSKLQ